MAARALTAHDVLHQLLSYDAETGRLRWKWRDTSWFEPSATRSAEHIAALWNARYAGTPALDGIDGNGYRHGHLSGRIVKAHRIIFKMLHGYEPEQIDHENGDRSDNRQANLVAATNATNTKNAKRRADNTSGVVGVTWYPHERVTGKWLAKIKGKHLGMFDQFDEAVAARKAAEIEYGFHRNHGRAA